MDVGIKMDPGEDICTLLGGKCESPTLLQLLKENVIAKKTCDQTLPSAGHVLNSQGGQAKQYCLCNSNSGQVFLVEIRSSSDFKGVFHILHAGKAAVM